MANKPLCVRCREQIRKCLPCCRHGGWVHAGTGSHLCDPKNPLGTVAEVERWLTVAR